MQGRVLRLSVLVVGDVFLFISPADLSSCRRHVFLHHSCEVARTGLCSEASRSHESTSGAEISSPSDEPNFLPSDCNQQFQRATTRASPHRN